MTIRVLILLLATVCLYSQTAQFPASLADDQDLLVAKDNATSTLSAGINSSTLTVTVADGTKFAQYSTVTIDSEQMQICSIVSNTLTMCTGTRGFGGTTAATHASGASVRGTITAWHHNALREEIQAMQAALGANLSGVVAIAGTQTITGAKTFSLPVASAAATTQDQVITLGSTPPVENRVLYWESGGRVGNTTFEAAEVVVLSGWSLSGSGAVIPLATSPTFVTPILGVATATAGTGNGHVIPLSGGVPTDDHCAKFDVTGGNITITSAGAICGGGGGFDIDALTEEPSPANLALAYIPFSNNGDDRRINIEDFFALFTTPTEWYFEDVTAASTATATSAEHSYGVCPVSVILSTTSGSTRTFTEVFDALVCDTGTLDATAALSSFTGRVYFVPPLIGGGVGGGGGGSDAFGSGDPGSNGMMVRTALNTSVAVNMAAATGLSWTNANGLSGNPTVAFAINDLTANASPDSATTYGLIFNVTTGTHQRVLLSNWPGGGGGGGDITECIAGVGLSGGATSGACTLNIDTATVPSFLTDTASLDFGSLAQHACQQLNITVAGAVSGDAVHVGPPATLEAGLNINSVKITSANTVTIELCKTTTGTIDPANATWRAWVGKVF